MRDCLQHLLVLKLVIGWRYQIWKGLDKNSNSAQIIRNTQYLRISK